MFFGVLGQISMFSSLMLSFLYLILVSLVYYQERFKQTVDKKAGFAERTQTVNEAKYDLEKAQKFDDMKLIYLWDYRGDTEDLKPIKWSAPLNRLNYVSGDARIKLLSRKFRSAVQLTMAKIENNKKKWDRLSFSEKIREVIFYPTSTMFKYSMPPCKIEEFSKNHAISTVPHYSSLPDPGARLFHLSGVQLSSLVGILCSPDGRVCGLDLRQHYSSVRKNPPKVVFTVSLPRYFFLL